MAVWCTAKRLSGSPFTGMLDKIPVPPAELTGAAGAPRLSDNQKGGRPAMPMPADTDVSTPKYLRDKYAIVGVGETTFTRGSEKTTRALGTWALRNAIADAGIKASDIDGML